MEGCDGWRPRRSEVAMKRYPGIRRLGPKKYRIRVTTTCPSSGKRKEIDRIVCGVSQKEALQVQAELREELCREVEEREDERGLDGISVRDYGNRWFERRKPKLKHSTRLRYAEHLDRINDVLGEIEMAALTPAIVSDYLADEAERYSGWTCVGRLRILRTMTRDAQAELGLDRWACERVTRPKPVERYSEEKPNALSAKELAKLWETMRESEPAMFPLFAVMATTGLRFAEATALKWSDIDAEAEVIHIRRNQYRGVIGSPKTSGSRRRLPLIAELAEVLEEHRSKQVRENPEDWVFPSSRGTLLSNTAFAKPLDRAAKKAGITHRITPHGLRRTLNTLALAYAPAETIRQVLGHSTREMTEHYNAPDLGARRALLSRLAAIACGDRGGDQQSPPEKRSR